MLCIVGNLNCKLLQEKQAKNMEHYRMESTPLSSLIAPTFVLESWNKGPIGRMVNYMYVHCKLYTVQYIVQYSTLHAHVRPSLGFKSMNRNSHNQVSFLVYVRTA